MKRRKEKGDDREGDWRRLFLLMHKKEQAGREK